MQKTPVMTNFWLVFWALLLSVGWLLPNHYLPWPSFHLEAWVAAFLLGAGLAVLLRTSGCVTVHPIALTVLLACLVPFSQYWAGMHESVGPVWVATAYLLGLFLAMMVGARWESAAPGQLADGLFLAISVAAILSVGLQLHQWLFLGRLFLWDMGSEGIRPFANIGQPNLLATFLVWGLLATAWFLQRKYIGFGVFILLSCYLLFGLAMTSSRTAQIAIVALIACSWWWRGLWRSRFTPIAMTGLGGYLWFCIYAKGWLRAALLLNEIEDVTRVAREERPQVWAMFLDAVFQRPLFGYGWGQISHAHLTVALDHPPRHILFTSAHNLLLDLMLWCGIPLGLLFFIALLWWLWGRIKIIKDAESALLLMLVLVLANHSMLEYPLAYAYFLLPAGMVIGALDSRLNAPKWHICGKWGLVCVAAASTLVLTTIARDYFRVETSYLALRFELADLKSEAPKEPPDVLLLTHLRDLIRYARFEPHKNMSAKEIQWMVSVAKMYPSAGIVHKLAAAMAWNHQPEMASLWLARLCSVAPAAQCEAVRQAWLQQGRIDRDIGAIAWPYTDIKQAR